MHDNHPISAEPASSLAKVARNAGHSIIPAALAPDRTQSPGTGPPRPCRGQQVCRPSPISAAIADTVIGTAKRNAVDPHAGLADALARIPDYKISQVDDLLPWQLDG